MADMIAVVRDLSMTESCRGQRETEAAVESVFPSSEFSQAQASPTSEAVRSGTAACRKRCSCPTKNLSAKLNPVPI